MVELRRLIKKISKSDTTVLILGESGTGKDLTARAIHECSPRNSRPFIPVNCGAIPKDLLESELFGHKKGSFTGAISDRKGRFQLADKGTLFLDEIGDMSLDLQVKLLRVLQERRIDPVGSNNSVEIDVRVIAATHKDIESLINNGKLSTFKNKDSLLIGYSDRLSDIRRNRVALMQESRSTNYTDINSIKKEVEDSKNLFKKYSWPTIDVTRKSVEETAASIIKIIEIKKNK